MKERPILFSGPMVRAILEGRKTQTRRLVSPMLIEALGDPSTWQMATASSWWAFNHLANEMQHFISPFGQPGDRLWVRETWGLDDCGEDGKRVIWQATCEAAWVMPRNELGEIYYLPSDYNPGRWRPSIHMPRWASRLTLEVTEVRVQRLQEISEEDAMAEGALADRQRLEVAGATLIADVPSARRAFRRLWDSINGEREGCAWTANPWVWAITFKVVE